LEIGFGDTEMDIANVEAVEWRTVGTRSCATFRGSSGPVLLGFGKLGDNRNTFQLLTRQLDGFGNGIFVLELDVTDARLMLAYHMHEAGERDLPLGAASDAIFHDLGLNNRADALEELSKVAGLCALRYLLNEDGALIAVVLGDFGRSSLRAPGVVASFAGMASTTAVSGPIARAVLVVTVAAGRTRSGTTTAAVVITAGISTATAGTTTTVAITGVATSVTIFICVSVFARSGTASISSPMVPRTASTPVSI
jgi:hypothetical protein